MKTRRVLLILLIVLILATSGSVVAYMYTRTGVRENTFLPAQVSCTVNETVQDNAKTSIVVSNTSNIEAYVRLRLVSYWVNSSDEVIAKRATLPALTPDNGLASGWLAGPNDTYYYSYPVGAAPDGTTPNLLATGASIPMAVDEDGNRQVIEVFAEAIQSKPRDNTNNVVASKWGVTVDATGTITAAPTEATTDEP